MENKQELEPKPLLLENHLLSNFDEVEGMKAQYLLTRCSKTSEQLHQFYVESKQSARKWRIGSNILGYAAPVLSISAAFFAFFPNAWVSASLALLASVISTVLMIFNVSSNEAKHRVSANLALKLKSRVQSAKDKFMIDPDAKRWEGLIDLLVEINCQAADLELEIKDGEDLEGQKLNQN